jgi:hypothetical protein
MTSQHSSVVSDIGLITPRGSFGTVIILFGVVINYGSKCYAPTVLNLV